MKIVPVEHMDDVLKEALAVDAPGKHWAIRSPSATAFARTPDDHAYPAVRGHGSLRSAAEAGRGSMPNQLKSVFNVGAPGSPLRPMLDFVPRA